MEMDKDNGLYRLEMNNSGPYHLELALEIAPEDISTLLTVVGLLTKREALNAHEALLAVVRLEYRARMRFPLMPWPQLPPEEIAAARQLPDRSGLWIAAADLAAEPPVEGEEIGDSKVGDSRVDQAPNTTPASADTVSPLERRMTLTARDWWIAKEEARKLDYMPRKWRDVFSPDYRMANFAKRFKPRRVEASEWGDDAGRGLSGYLRLRRLIIADGYLADEPATKPSPKP